MSHLDPADVRAIHDDFERLIEAKENPEVATSSWLPGADWTGTPFMPISERAAGADIDAAGKCFGLMLWTFLMEHPEDLSFGHYQVNDIPIHDSPRCEPRPLPATAPQAAH
jgi:hypothetical protein